MNQVLKGSIAVEEPDPIDVHIGARIRGRRKQIDMSQEGLAKDIGVSFQQVQKYERGANRVSGSMLLYIARALGVPVAHFYEGLDDTEALAADPQTLFFAEPGAVRLADNYMRLPDAQRKAVVGLAVALGTGAAA
jgi:transcriptional regulator with XRE-family HTH domain